MGDRLTSIRQSFFGAKGAPSKSNSPATQEEENQKVERPDPAPDPPSPKENTPPVSSEQSASANMDDPSLEKEKTVTVVFSAKSDLRGLAKTLRDVLEEGPGEGSYRTTRISQGQLEEYERALVISGVLLKDDPGQKNISQKGSQEATARHFAKRYTGDPEFKKRVLEGEFLPKSALGKSVRQYAVYMSNETYGSVQNIVKEIGIKRALEKKKGKVCIWHIINMIMDTFSQEIAQEQETLGI